jgi:hypothetical protein
MSDEREFRHLVRAMRAAQVAYFKRRDPGLLDVARGLERRVDRALEADRQPELFDAPATDPGDAS